MRYIVYQIRLQGIYESKSKVLVTVALFQLVIYEHVILYMSVCLSTNVFICLWLNQSQFPTLGPLSPLPRQTLDIIQLEFHWNCV